MITNAAGLTEPLAVAGLPGPYAAELLQALPDSTVVVSNELSVLFACRNAAQLLGSEQTGRSFLETYPQFRGSNVMLDLREAVSSRKPFDVELFLPLTRQWIELRARPQQGLVCLFLREITQRRGVQDELRRFADEALSAKEALETQASELANLNIQLEVSRQMAEEARRTAEAANLAKSSFLANMSHEIRTPMTAIVGFADLLLEPAQSEDQRRECLSTIRRNARHLLELINDILDLSKIEAGKMTVEHIEVNVPKFVAEVVSMMRPRAIEKGLDFQLVFDGAVRRVAVTDSLRVKQILVNLIGNAIKFTPSGMVMLRISDSPGSTMRFDVVDTGVGIATEHQASLFEAFVQEDGSTTRRFGGSGLGLAISQRLARHLGGDIRLQSEPGRGSLFSVEIDAGSHSAERIAGLEEVEVPSAARLSGEEASLPPCRILLVEDGKDNQKLIGSHLRRAGAVVTIADNGRVALTTIEQAQEPFDIVLMDMQMPELDGYGAASELRKRGFETPIIALTAHAMSDDRQKCIQAGCTDYLTKPIDRIAMIETLTRYLSPQVKFPPANQPPSGIFSPGATAHSEPFSAKIFKMPNPTDMLISEFQSDPDMVELITDFTRGLSESVAVLLSALKDGRTADIGRRAHQLKGSGGGFGFPKITDAAAATESAVKTGSADLAEKVQALVDVCRSVRGYDLNAEAAALADAVKKSA